MEYQEGKTWNW